ncbi:MAG: MarC family protein [Limnospira sp.]
MLDSLLQSSTFLFVLLNPFLMSIYLIDLIQELDIKIFANHLIRGTIISGFVFILFSWFGESIFTQVLRVDFESFLVFGGIIFLILAVRFFFGGSQAIGQLRGKPKDIAITIAMPYMIGPGTVSASVLAGSRLPPPFSALAIALTLSITALSILFFKWLHDYVKQRNEALIERYIDIAGRTTAMILGTFSIDMILQGIEIWFKKF